MASKVRDIYKNVPVYASLSGNLWYEEVTGVSRVYRMPYGSKKGWVQTSTQFVPIEARDVERWAERCGVCGDDFRRQAVLSHIEWLKRSGMSVHSCGKVTSQKICYVKLRGKLSLGEFGTPSHIDVDNQRAA